MRKVILILAVSVLGISAFAESPVLNFEVRKTDSVFEEISIFSQGVKGVNVVLKKTFDFIDCNAKSLIAEPTLVSGEGNGVGDVFFVNGHIISTARYCEIYLPAQQTISAEPMFFIADSTGLVDISLIISDLYEIEVQNVY